MKARLGVAATAVLLAVGLAGCTGDADPGPQTVGPSSTSSGSSSAATSEPSSSAAPSTAPKPEQTFPPEQQPIAEAYWAYYDAFYALRTQTDDEVRAALSPFAVSARVEKVVSTFAEFRAAGKEPAGTPGYGPLEIAVTNAAATVIECHDASQETIVDVASGAVLESGSVGTKLETELILDSTSQTWVVDKAYGESNAC